MQISKNAWHYNLNSSIQGWPFIDRAHGRKFTTCTYIRTTIRSVLQVVASGVGIISFILLALGLFLNAAWFPLALLLDLPYIKELAPMAGAVWVIGIVGLLVQLVSWLMENFGAKLSERQERKLNLLEQRIKDGKEGICTIVEIV